MASLGTNESNVSASRGAGKRPRGGRRAPAAHGAGAWSPARLAGVGDTCTAQLHSGSRVQERQQGAERLPSRPQWPRGGGRIAKEERQLGWRGLGWPGGMGPSRATQQTSAGRCQGLQGPAGKTRGRSAGAQDRVREVTRPGKLDCGEEVAKERRRGEKLPEQTRDGAARAPKESPRAGL